MTFASLAYLVGVLLIARAMLQLGTREAYCCPVCGSKREDGHAEDCPWRRAS
ncbi:MAG: hypothetical protein JWO17_1331 [Actinomycetia bacterium]|nr:hypothetical protein [Actinomycetes bacterium]